MFYDFSGIIKQFGNHVARIAVVFMIFSTGMFISAAGEYKCWLNALIQNLETSGFFFSLTSSKINHFDLKHFKLKHTGTFKSLQIAGNEWDLNCIVVDCVMLQRSPSWIRRGGWEPRILWKKKDRLVFLYFECAWRGSMLPVHYQWSLNLLTGVTVALDDNFHCWKCLN